ncbi:MAG: hypothetical protein ACRDGQ_11270 [Candidatus Limnocylindrales bacterium]
MALVVQHGDGSSVARCVAFSGPSLTGEAVLSASGLSYATIPYGFGKAVCQVDGEPATFPASCWTTTSRFWTLFVAERGGSWFPATLGVSVQVFHDGDSEGLRYEPQDGPIAPTASGNCPTATPPPSATPPPTAATAPSVKPSRSPTPAGTPHSTLTSSASPITSTDPGPSGSSSDPATPATPGEASPGDTSPGEARPSPSTGPVAIGLVNPGASGVPSLAIPGATGAGESDNPSIALLVGLAIALGLGALAVIQARARPPSRPR